MAVWLPGRTRSCSSPLYPDQRPPPTVSPTFSNFFMLFYFVEFRQTDLCLKQMRETQFELFWGKKSIYFVFVKDSVNLNSYYCPGAAVHANLSWNFLSDFLRLCFQEVLDQFDHLFPQRAWQLRTLPAPPATHTHSALSPVLYLSIGYLLAYCIF